MKTARETAEAVLPTRYRGLCKPGNEHHQDCDALTAAIEARDAEHEREFDKLYDDRKSVAAERDRLREALERLAAVVCQTCRRDADARAALKAPGDPR